MKDDIIELLYPYSDYINDEFLKWVVDGHVNVGIFNIVHNGVGGNKKKKEKEYVK